MLIYITLISVLIIAHIISVKTKKNNSYAFLSVVAFIIIIQGMRSFSVGVDLKAYEPIFLTTSVSSFKEIINSHKDEWLFYILNWLVSLVGGNFRTFLFLVSISIFVPLALIILKYSKMPYLSLLLFIYLDFFVFTLSGLRQTMAIGVTLISFIYIKKRKIIPFFVLVTIACLFHKSAFVFFLAYPIYHFRLNKNNYIFLVFIAPPFFIFRKEIVTTLGKLYNGFYEVVETGAYNYLLMLIAFFIASLVVLINNDKKENAGLINFLYAAIIIQFFAGYSQVVMRFNLYYIIYLILLVPEIVVNLERYSYRFVFETFVILFLGLMFFYKIKGNVMEVYPYTFLARNVNLCLCFIR